MVGCISLCQNAGISVIIGASLRNVRGRSIKTTNPQIKVAWVYLKVIFPKPFSNCTEQHFAPCMHVIRFGLLSNTIYHFHPRIICHALSNVKSARLLHTKKIWIPLKLCTYVFESIHSYVSCDSHTLFCAVSSNSIEKLILNTIKAIEHKGFRVSSSPYLLLLADSMRIEMAYTQWLPTILNVRCMTCHIEFGFIGHSSKIIRIMVYNYEKTVSLRFFSDISCNTWPYFVFIQILYEVKNTQSPRRADIE